MGETGTSVVPSALDFVMYAVGGLAAVPLPALCGSR
jgi:hypothetical protein